MRFGANHLIEPQPIHSVTPASHLADHGGSDDGGNGGVFDGSGGSVNLEGTDGVDTFVIPTVADSTGINFDTIERFDFSQGDTINLPGAVTGIDAAVSGALSSATFDTDLGTALGANQLAADHAVLFTASSGDFHGETFLVVDGNDTAGYQAGQDFVIRLDDSSPFTGLTTANFTTGAPPPFTGGDDDDQGDRHGNHMNGDDGNNHIDGNGGNDSISGGGGDDDIDGGTGNDKLDGGAGADHLVGATGNDHMTGGIGGDTMEGDNGDDRLSGGDGDDHVSGGDGNDTMNGGKGNDTMNGGGGADNMNGGPGADTFVFNAVSDSTSTTFDTIHGFDPHHGDVFDLPFAVTGVDAAINSGALSLATFDADLSTAVGANQLAAGHAVVFTATSGTLRHDTFLVIDANGQAGYQAGQDIVIHLDNPNHIDSIGLASFV